jgi:glycerate-2-kinase
MVVTVHGDGAGGRNTEAALAAAIRLSGTSGVTIGFLATDGDDASTGVAGAIVDGESIVGSEMIARARAALARNDSATFLRDRSATWETGLTGTKHD